MVFGATLHAVTLVLANRIPVRIKAFADDLDRRCKIRWAVDWLIVLFSGGLIQRAVVMSPGCNELANSTIVSSSLELGQKRLGQILL